MLTSRGEMRDWYPQYNLWATCNEICSNRDRYVIFVRIVLVLFARETGEIRSIARNSPYALISVCRPVSRESVTIAVPDTDTGCLDEPNLSPLPLRRRGTKARRQSGANLHLLVHHILRRCFQYILRADGSIHASRSVVPNRPNIRGHGDCPDARDGRFALSLHNAQIVFARSHHANCFAMESNVRYGQSPSRLLRAIR